MKKIFAIFAAIVSIVANSLLALAQEQYESSNTNEQKIKQVEEGNNRKQNVLLGKTFNALNDLQKAKVAYILNGHSVAGKWNKVFKADSLKEEGVFSTPNAKFTDGGKVPDLLTVYTLTSNGWTHEVRIANNQYFYVLYNGMPIVEVVNNRAVPKVLIVESSSPPSPIAPIFVPRTVTVTVSAPKIDTTKKTAEAVPCCGDKNVFVNGDNNTVNYNEGVENAGVKSGRYGYPYNMDPNNPLLGRISDSGLGFQTVASANSANFGYPSINISSYSGYPHISLGGILYVQYQNTWWNWGTRRVCDSGLNYQLSNAYYGNNQNYAYNTPKPKPVITNSDGGGTGDPHVGSTGGGPVAGSTGKVFKHR